MRILHAIHDFLPVHRAGSEIYCLELARRQHAMGHETHVLCAEYDAKRPHGSLVWRDYEGLPVTEVVNNWLFEDLAESYGSPRLDTQLEHVLRATAPDVLHIHNLLNLSMNLPRIARRLGIPSVATLHDFTILCPSGGQRIHQAERHVCFEIDPERCARCFPQSHFHQQMVFARLSRASGGLRVAAPLAQMVRRLTPRLFERLGRTVSENAPRAAITARDIETRLARAREVFREVDLWISPSAALAADYERFGMPPEKIRVSDYGFVPLPSIIPSTRPKNPAKLRIGFVGTLVWHKGAHVLLEAARHLPPEGWEMHVFGNLDTFPAYVADLRRTAAGLPVHFHGGFDRDRIAEVYDAMDVLVVASLWPENSPLVIHEAFQAGVPVVGARMGGIVDLVEDGKSGLLYDAFDPESLARALASLLEDPAQVTRFADDLPEVKTIEQDAEEWDAVYREILRERDG